MAGRERSGPAAATGDAVRRPAVGAVPGAGDRRAGAARRAGARRARAAASPVELAAGPSTTRRSPWSATCRRSPRARSPPCCSRGGRARRRLAGPGLQDTTRIAASDPALWGEVLRLNAADVAPLRRATSPPSSTAAAAALDRVARPATTRSTTRGVLRRGDAGRALVPVKRGERDARLRRRRRCRCPTGPGSWPALLVGAGEAGVNVEDVRVEHVPGRPTRRHRAVACRDPAARQPSRAALRGRRLGRRSAGPDRPGHPAPSARRT